MKKALTFFVVLALLVSLAVPAKVALAQNQATENRDGKTGGSKLPDGVVELKKSDLPDLSKLHPLVTKFFVANDTGWRLANNEGEIGSDIKIFRFDPYSKDAESEDIVATVLNSSDGKNAIAYFWKNEGEGYTCAIVLENGKIVSVPNGDIDFGPIFKDDHLAGVKVKLLHGGNEVAARDVLAKDNK